jgi:hypothetical protein
MKYFSKLDANNIVVDCLGVNDSDAPDEATGQTFLRNLTNDSSSIWKETSRENSGNGFRGNMGGIGCTYMTGVRTMGVASTDVFLQQQPFPSWSVGITTAEWYPPNPPGDRPHVGIDSTGWYEWSESNYNTDPTTAWVFKTP